MMPNVPTIASKVESQVSGKSTSSIPLSCSDASKQNTINDYAPQHPIHHLFDQPYNVGHGAALSAADTSTANPIMSGPPCKNGRSLTIAVQTALNRNQQSSPVYPDRSVGLMSTLRPISRGLSAKIDTLMPGRPHSQDLFLSFVSARPATARYLLPGSKDDLYHMDASDCLMEVFSRFEGESLIISAQPGGESDVWTWGFDSVNEDQYKAFAAGPEHRSKNVIQMGGGDLETVHAFVTKDGPSLITIWVPGEYDTMKTLVDGVLATLSYTRQKHTDQRVVVAFSPRLSKDSVWPLRSQPLPTEKGFKELVSNKQAAIDQNLGRTPLSEEESEAMYSRLDVLVIPPNDVESVCGRAIERHIALRSYMNCQEAPVSDSTTL